MTHRYTIAAVVPEPWDKQFDDLRKQHDRWSKQWLPPHITIIPPFEAELPFDVVKEIEETPLEIMIDLGAWGTFTHFRTNTIWIESGDKSTADARRRLIQAVPRLDTITAYPPILWDEPSSHHITVVNHVPHDELEKVKHELSLVDLEGSFNISHLTVFHWDRRLGRWLKVRPT